MDNISKIISFLVFLSMTALAGAQVLAEEGNTILLADPTIFEHQGTYYLYGTKQDPSIEGEGFLVYTSKDLRNWNGPSGASNGFALLKGDAFGTKGFWAPQIFEHQEKFYMAYTADEQIAIATSDSPLGPFRNDSKAIKAVVNQIDPFLFIDDDGSKYLYHVRLEEGNRIFVAEMSDDLEEIKPETVTAAIDATQAWENTQQVEWPVAEGPTVVKNEGKYYLIYSANDFRNPDYAVGYAMSDSPMGPWTKAINNPLIHGSMLGVFGSGHGDVITDKEGQMKYVLHTHFSADSVHPRKTALLNINFTPEKGGVSLEIDKNSFRFQRLDKQ